MGIYTNLKENCYDSCFCNMNDVFLTLTDQSCIHFLDFVTAISAAFVFYLHNLKPWVFKFNNMFYPLKREKILTILALLCRFFFCGPSYKE